MMISSGVDLRSSRKNYSVQVFKAMQGVRGWMGPLDIYLSLIVVGILFRHFFFFGFNITCHLRSDRGFKCRLLNVINVV